MIVHSYNEWSPLRRVVLGQPWGANWPEDDPVFSQESSKTSWKETPPPSGQVPWWIQSETAEDLAVFESVMLHRGIEVVKPASNNFVATRGMYNYCPRDRLIIAGNRVIDPAMMYPCRDQEIDYLRQHLGQSEIISMPRGQSMVMDAANVCRLGDDWLFLISSSGNLAAYEWLVQTLPEVRIHRCDFYAGVHIDSTVVPLREGLVMLNASRVNDGNLPDVLKSWDKIWVEDCVAGDFYQYPYASKWIGMNTLSLDPETVIVDALQTDLIQRLEQRGMTVIPLRLRHSRTLGGGFHCVTLDLHRE